MKHRHLFFALVIWGIVGLGCGFPSFVAQVPQATPAPVKTLRPTFTAMPAATETLPPTPTPTPAPTDTPLPSATPLPLTDTAEPPTPTPIPPTQAPPTDTPEPPTPTPAPPTATRAPAQPTKVPPTPVPKPEAKHVVGSHGVSGLVVARDKTTFAVGETAYFTYEALNHTQNPVGFEKLGIKASNGLFNTSWINPDIIQPGTPFKHDDGLAFSSPGTYKVFLAICFARCSQGDADWEEFPLGAATIIVK